MKFTAEHLLLFERLQIRYYGIIIVIAMLVAAWVAARLAKRSGLDPDHIWGGLTWAIIPGIIFARLFYVIFPPASACPDPNIVDKCLNTAWYLQNFFNLQNGAIAIWSGGLNIFGAVIGGFGGAYLYMRRNKLPMGVWLDIAAVALPLGQAIGRWANAVNQELYGIAANVPWGISIDREHRVGIYKDLSQYPAIAGADKPLALFHPLFLYESLWSVLAFIVLLNIYQKRRKKLLPGDLFLLYIMQYTFIRFVLEFIRVEVAYIPGTGINLWQVVSVLLFIAALGSFVYRHLDRGEQAAVMPESAPPAEKPAS